MELTSQQRDTLMKEVAQEAGWAKIELPDMVANKPEAVNAYHEALKEASVGDKFPDWSKAMQLKSYDSNRHDADLEKARTLQTQGAYLAEHSNSNEDRYHLTIDHARYGAELPKFAAEHTDRSLVSIYREEIKSLLHDNLERYERWDDRFREVNHQGPGFTQINLAYELQDKLYTMNRSAAVDLYDRAHGLDKAKAADQHSWDASMKSLNDLTREPGDNRRFLEERAGLLPQERGGFHRFSGVEIDAMKLAAVTQLEKSTGIKLDEKNVEMAQPGKSYSGEVVMSRSDMVAQYNDSQQKMIIHNGWTMDGAEKGKLEVGKAADINYSPGGNAVVHAREQEMQHQGREAARNMESSRDLERGR